jgi:hypothetical protein
MTSSGCAILRQDTAASSDLLGMWGSIDCASSSRVAWSATSGDPHQTADGSLQGNTAYRTLTVLDGDNFYGERCEIGRNERRYGEGGSWGTLALYKQGQHRITYFSERYPAGFQPNVNAWQTVAQMKQTQPYVNDGGNGVALELQIYGGQLRLFHNWTQQWATPAPASGSWTRYALDVVYSTDPAVGSVKVYVDLNGDGDALDAGEQSPLMHMATLETEAGSGGDGIGPGDPIPDHLRLGVYHDPSISCPAPTGCSVQVDNVQIVNG